MEPNPLNHRNKDTTAVAPQNPRPDAESSKQPSLPAHGGASVLQSRSQGRPRTQGAAAEVPQRRRSSGGAAKTPKKREGGGKSASTPKSKQSRPQQKTPSDNLFDRKLNPPFEDYWSRERVQQGLKRGELVQGVLRINQKNYEEAFIDDPEGCPDYFIQGIQARNRTLQGDTVVVQVLPEDQWVPELKLPEGLLDSTSGLPSSESTVQEASTRHIASESLSTVQSTVEQISKLGIGEEHPGVSNSPSMQSGENLAVSEAAGVGLRPTLIDVLYSTPSIGTPVDCGASEGVVRKKAANKEQYLHRRTCKVVYIVEKGHSRACAGNLKAFDKEKGLALISPRESRVPRVIVPLASCPEDYSRVPRKYAEALFVCKIDRWHADSPFPFGTLMRSMGEAGEIEPETECFLIENEVEFCDFPPEANECLPKNLPWTIPKDELAKRKDFRRDCVFSIDPATARDLDDALHIKEVDKGVFEVGVHIADVSYFVQAGSALDDVASRRATSVYLVQRVIPMLPRLLCEQLCSLNPNEDRLTFSVVWRITGQGELLSEWMGRSVICSCAKLSYDHAQMMIDEPQRQWEDGDLPPITGGFSPLIVSEAVTTLNKLAKQLGAQRQTKGTLRLNQPRMVFPLDKDTGLPNGCSVYQQKESNRLIEEFMLLANMAVARKIHKAFPDLALLRRHPTPKERAADFLVATCNGLGIHLDTSSASSIQQSLDQYHGRTADEERSHMEKMILVVLCSKIMEFARYFCTGAVDKESDYIHYALNVPRYTHFTSPIRRYADIIVHRQLADAMGEGPPCTLTVDEVDSQAEQCNRKKKNAKVVEDLSGQLFFSLFLRKCGPLTEKGMVMAVLDKAFDVLVTRLGVVKRIYCQKLPVKSYQFHTKGTKKIPYLTLVWAESDNKMTTDTPRKQDLTYFSPVEVVLSESKKSLQYEATITPPRCTQM